MLASCSFDGTVRLWQASAACDAAAEAAAAALQSGSRVRTHLCPTPLAVLRDGPEAEMALLGHEASISCVSLPRGDERRLVRGGNDGLLKLWDLVTLKPVLSLAGHERWLWSLECLGDAGGDGSPDVFASGSVDGTVKLWDVRAPPPAACVATLELENAGPVAGLAVRPGGRHLATGTFDDAAVRLFDLRGAGGGRLLGVMHGHVDRVTRLCATDALLASASFDSTVRVWRFDHL